jgi:hypothetical protein
MKGVRYLQKKYRAATPGVDCLYFSTADSTACVRGDVCEPSLQKTGNTQKKYNKIKMMSNSKKNFANLLFNTLKIGP